MLDFTTVGFPAFVTGIHGRLTAPYRDMQVLNVRTLPAGILNIGYAPSTDPLQDYTCAPPADAWAQDLSFCPDGSQCQGSWIWDLNNPQKITRNGHTVLAFGMRAEPVTEWAGATMKLGTAPSGSGASAIPSTPPTLEVCIDQGRRYRRRLCRRPCHRQRFRPLRRRRHRPCAWITARPAARRPVS